MINPTLRHFTLHYCGHSLIAACVRMPSMINALMCTVAFTAVSNKLSVPQTLIATHLLEHLLIAAAQERLVW